MEFIKTFLEQQPMMALFLTIAIGCGAGFGRIDGASRFPASGGLN